MILQLPELHVVEVQETLDCLIPGWLHPDMDGKKPRGKVEAGAGAAASVELKAGNWRLDAFDGDAIGQGFAVPKSAVEFFVQIARHICKKMKLPLCVGTCEVGRLLAEQGSTAAELMLKIPAHFKAEYVSKSREFVAPVNFGDQKVDPRDWVMLSVCDADAADIPSASVLELAGVADVSAPAVGGGVAAEVTLDAAGDASFEEAALLARLTRLENASAAEEAAEASAGSEAADVLARLALLSLVC